MESRADADPPLPPAGGRRSSQPDVEVAMRCLHTSIFALNISSCLSLSLTEAAWPSPLLSSLSLPSPGPNPCPLSLRRSRMLHTSSKYRFSKSSLTDIVLSARWYTYTFLLSSVDDSKEATMGCNAFKSLSSASTSLISLASSCARSSLILLSTVQRSSYPASSTRAAAFAFFCSRNTMALCSSSASSRFPSCATALDDSTVFLYCSTMASNGTFGLILSSVTLL
mmetsp:Transcript_8069/g.21313  ORF Transcript_8069/g.21313 Transcript_8069/m.21313 type:complete len:225 (+) Transcript_8069:1694-2368(+)